MSLTIDSRCADAASIFLSRSMFWGGCSLPSMRFVNPMIAFIGVRNSWLMLATKSLFARFASRADSIAAARARWVSSSTLFSNTIFRPAWMPSRNCSSSRRYTSLKRFSRLSSTHTVPKMHPSGQVSGSPQ